jgi:CheY-like chemotaxis protein
MRLLLVEDDQILGSSLQKALEKHAYGVDWLQDGESALAALDDCQNPQSSGPADPRPAACAGASSRSIPDDLRSRKPPANASRRRRSL